MEAVEEEFSPQYNISRDRADTQLPNLKLAKLKSMAFAPLTFGSSPGSLS